MLSNIHGLISPTTINGTDEYYITSQSISFSNDYIQCSLPTCSIICSNPQNCESLQINASLSSILKLQCSQYRSCYSSIIIEGPSNSVSISCSDHGACSQSTYNIENTLNVNINCNNINCIGCKANNGSCSHTTFNAQYSINVDIHCQQRYDCYQSIFNVNNTDITHIQSYKYALWKATVRGTGIIKELTINCSGDSGCRKSAIYCPLNVPCNVYCDDIGSTNVCREMDIYLPTKDILLFNVSCGTLETYCDELQFFCQDTSEVTKYILYHDSYICQQWQCCPVTLQPPAKLIECTDDSQCVIDCTDYGETGCQKAIINGTNASSLTINCNNEYECQYCNIKCPQNGDCTLNCLKSRSCQRAVFIPETVTGLNVNCIGSTSCMYMDIIGLTIMSNVTISCLSGWSCSYADYNLTVYGDSIDLLCMNGNGVKHCLWIDFVVQATKETNITITATTQESLDRADVIITQANVVTINCIDATYNNRACQQLETITDDVNALDITCQDFRSCWLSDWDLHAKDISFICNGSSSCEVNTITANISGSMSITSINETAFMHDGINVYCWDCMNLYNCLENMTIYCGSDVSPYSITDNDQCRNCLCDNNITNTEQYLPFSDGVWQQCIPTPKPTALPTKTPTDDPTIDPTRDPTTNPTTSDPTVFPTFIPTVYPTSIPTLNPTADPTKDPVPNEVKVDDDDDMTIIPTKPLIDGKNDKVNVKEDQTTSIIGIVMGVIIFLIVIVVTYIVCRCKQKQNVNVIQNTNTMLESEKQNVEMMKHRQLQTNSFVTSYNGNINMRTPSGNDDTLEIAGVLDVENDGIIIGDDEVVTSGDIVDDDTSGETSENIDDENGSEIITAGNNESYDISN